MRPFNLKKITLNSYSVNANYLKVMNMMLLISTVSIMIISIIPLLLGFNVGSIRFPFRPMEINKTFFMNITMILLGDDIYS